jgi:hypothetical protein
LIVVRVVVVVVTEVEGEGEMVVVKGSDLDWGSDGKLKK